MKNIFKNLFVKGIKISTPATEEPLTVPISQSQGLHSVIETIEWYPHQLVVGTGQSEGRQRDHNEDALFTLTSVLADGNGQNTFGIFIIADGMGGHQHGEVASSVAVRVMADYLVNALYSNILRDESDSQSDSLQEIMEKGVYEAHQEVLKKAPGGGTTLTAALVMGNHVTLAHVGDSRAYLMFEDNRMQVVTQDHSLVRRLVDLGQLSEEQARIYPQKNVVYRALGQLEPFKPDICTHMVPHPGLLMLCSDGLWGCVPEEEMIQIIKQNTLPSKACHKLVEAANLAGGPDNISVILATYL